MLLFSMPLKAAATVQHASCQCPLGNNSRPRLAFKICGWIFKKSAYANYYVKKATTSAITIPEYLFRNGRKGFQMNFFFRGLFFGKRNGDLIIFAFEISFPKEKKNWTELNFLFFLGDIAITVDLFGKHQGKIKVPSNWWQELNDKININKIASKELASDVSLPLNYYAVFDTLQHMMPKDAIIVSEGANTMDIGRTILANYLPKHRSKKFFFIKLTDLSLWDKSCWFDEFFR